MLTVAVAAALLALVLLVWGPRLLPLALAAAALGFAVNVFGVLPAPPAPLVGVGEEVEAAQRQAGANITCRAQVYAVENSTDIDQMAAAQRACQDAAGR